MKFFIYSKNKKTKEGRAFRAYWTYMMIVVKGEESKGKQRKAINVSFLQGVDHTKVVRGILDADIDAPFIYEIKKDEKTGKDRYPSIWVKRIDSYESKDRQHEQSDFFTEEVKGDETPELSDEQDTATAEINAADDPKLPF